MDDYSSLSQDELIKIIEQQDIEIEKLQSRRLPREFFGAIELLTPEEKKELAHLARTTEQGIKVLSILNHGTCTMSSLPDINGIENTPPLILQKERPTN